jgi:S1-C subfamily serine protease
MTAAAPRAWAHGLMAAALAAAPILAGPGAAALPPETLARVRESVYPALVNLTVVHQRFSEGRAERYPGAGSGVVVTPEGHVLTNFHVAGSTTRIDCTLTDGRVLPASVVAHDPLTDLSVLRLEAAPGERFAHARFGDSASLQVGDTVFAMGNPLALSSSMTQGIVSNPARVFTDFTGSEIEELDVAEGEPSGLFTRWIQHDALILPGNSGGPLVDLDGQVVGINELGGQGFGFAIPSAIAREVLVQVLEHGEVRRGTLGFSVLPVGRIGRESGALVATVLPGTPAERAGLLPGDLLTAIDGEQVSVRFVEQVPLLYQRIAGLAEGARVELAVERSGEERTLRAEVERLGAFRGEEVEVRELGLTAQAITRALAAARQLPSPDGVVITGVRPGGTADGARPRLQQGDVIATLGGERIGSLGALVARLAGWPAETPLPVGLWRDGEQLVSVLPPARAAGARWGGELPKAWLGVRTQVLTEELAASLGDGELRGFRVTQVMPGTSAARAGLHPGDVLTAVDEEPLEPSRPQDEEDLRRVVEELTVGATAVLRVWRSGQRLALPVELEARPPQADEVARAEQDTLEFAVRELTLEDRARKRWGTDLRGVLVSDAVRGGWAQMAGLRLDDLLMAVNDHPVPSVADFQRVMRRLAAERPPVVRLFVRRAARTHFVIVEPDWRAAGAPAP